MFTIGICGPSCSGKGAVTEYIAARNHQVIRICQDSFFKINSPVYTKGYMDIDVPEALMMDKLYESIAVLKHGHNSKVPYAGWTEQFNVEITQNDLKMRPILLVEGFLLFSDDNLPALFNSKIFINVSDLNILYRRLQRDKSIKHINFIYNVVIPNSWVYKDQQMGKADIVIDGNPTADDVISNVVEYINDHIKNKNLDVQIDNSPWKVFFNDLITDHEWHPIDYDSLKDWHREPANLKLLEDGVTLPGNTFAVRKSLYISDEYEIRLNDGCNLFRYENTPTRELGKY